MQDKGLRYDTVIAVSALLISAITAAAVVYQTHVIAQQFSATVWPYLSFDSTRDASHLSLALRNDGVGPALIRRVEFRLNGKRIPDLNAIVTPIVQQSVRASVRPRRRGVMRTTVASLEVGDVIPASQHVTLVDVSGSDLTKALVAQAPRFNLTVCYCSLLGRCWVKQFQDRSAEPHDVHDCARH